MMWVSKRSVARCEGFGARAKCWMQIVPDGKVQSDVGEKAIFPPGGMEIQRCAATPGTQIGQFNSKGRNSGLGWSVARERNTPAAESFGGGVSGAWVSGSPVYRRRTSEPLLGTKR